ncbi:MAG TPA: GNAT family N-acetyltransferase [Longimicrobiales bacterium]|nr:GNAT family N-acetyltransferase [Longimicrobiales bacterium]
MSVERGREVAIRDMTREDWPEVARIYAEGIDSGHATFETSVPDRDAWHAARLPACRLVATEGDRIVGFAALSPVSARPVYAGVAEVMVYVSADRRGRGIGGRLLETLVRASEEAGIWTLQAGVFPENEASVAVHVACGFRVVGVRERIGRFRDGRWRDVLLMERRSPVAGVD